MDLQSLSIRITRAPALAVLPQITNQILRLADKPDVSAKQIAALVEREPGLAAKLLKIANSSFYGVSGKILSVAHAVTFLGIGTVRSLAIGQAYQQLISSPGQSLRFDRVAFWQHSLATGVIARILARLVSWGDPEQAFMAGLLHDIGRLVLDRFLGREFDQAIQLSHERSCTLWEAEQEVLGYTHAEAGEVLGKQWNLPPVFQVVPRDHHRLVRFEEDELTCIVLTANVLAHQCGFAIGAPVDYEVPPEVQESLGIPAEQYEGIRQVALQEVTQTQGLLRA